MVYTDELPDGHQLLNGQYTIERYLAAGGFGITYLARDTLDRQVVIKECYPNAICRRTETRVSARSQETEADFASIVRLFLREARALSELQHPNIVEVKAYFEENDTAYMVLEYVRGYDLSDVIKDFSDRLTPDYLVGLTKKLLSAIEYTHSKDILHRDIKPENVLINAQGEPVLIDFGAARQEASESNRSLSSSIAVVSDGYSPQEFYIAGARQDQSSDLYALAATLYHCITGNKPSTSQMRAMRISFQEADPYKPLSTRQLDFPPGFLALIDRAMALAPKDRPQTVADWRAALEGKDPVSSTAGRKRGARSISQTRVPLSDFLADGTPGEGISTEQAIRWLKVMTNALKTAHQKGEIHQVISAADFEVVDGDKLQVIKVGASSPILKPDDYSDQPVDRSFVAPEVMEGGPKGYGTDLYAVAALMHCCMTGTILPPAQARLEALRQGTDDALVNAPMSSSRVARKHLGWLLQLLDKTLSLTLADRPTLNDFRQKIGLIAVDLPDMSDGKTAKPKKAAPKKAPPKSKPAPPPSQTDAPRYAMWRVGLWGVVMLTCFNVFWHAIQYIQIDDIVFRFSEERILMAAVGVGCGALFIIAAHFTRAFRPRFVVAGWLYVILRAIHGEIFLIETVSIYREVPVVLAVCLLLDGLLSPAHPALKSHMNRRVLGLLVALPPVLIMLTLVTALWNTGGFWDFFFSLSVEFNVSPALQAIISFAIIFIPILILLYILLALLDRGRNRA